MTEWRRFGKFLLVGGLNTLFGFAVYAAFVLLHCPAWLALLGGNVAGVLFNFFTTGRFVFLDLSTSRLPGFVAVYFFAYYTNLVLIGWVNHFVNNLILSQAILAPFMAALSFLLLSRLVFRNKRGTVA